MDACNVTNNFHTSGIINFKIENYTAGLQEEFLLTLHVHVSQHKQAITFKLTCHVLHHCPNEHFMTFVLVLRSLSECFKCASLSSFTNEKRWIFFTIDMIIVAYFKVKEHLKKSFLYSVPSTAHTACLETLWKALHIMHCKQPLCQVRL